MISFHVDAIAAYRPPLSDALVALKYRPDAAFAHVLAGWLQAKLITLAWEPEMIVPVPLGKVRKRERGYNQVELITSALAQSTKIPHGNSILKRVRNTRSQVGLDPTARFSNLEQAFFAERASVLGRRVLLVDDLLTSGATIVSCAEALFRGGASHVYALTIARA
jgi:competence protein ComFC